MGAGSGSSEEEDGLPPLEANANRGTWRERSETSESDDDEGSGDERAAHSGSEDAAART